VKFPKNGNDNIIRQASKKMLKVPAEFQVRIVKAPPEDAIPHFIIEEEREERRDSLSPLFNKTLRGGGVGILLGLGLYLALQICGVRFGSLETIIVLGIPCFTGIVTSYVIF
jgi:hypothetical protein